MTYQTHYFLAVPLEKNVTEGLAVWVDKYRKEYAFRTWVVPEDYHITLCFLGHVTSDQMNQLKNRLPQAIQECEPFFMRMAHFGQFGRETCPRIFWIAPAYESALNILQNKVAKVCSDIGFELENRPYRPHVTLARKWQGSKEFVLPDMEKHSELANLIWEVKEAVLYRSHRDMLPKYEPWMRFPLKSKPASGSFQEEKYEG